MNTINVTKNLITFLTFVFYYPYIANAQSVISSDIGGVVLDAPISNYPDPNSIEPGVQVQVYTLNKPDYFTYLDKSSPPPYGNPEAILIGTSNQWWTFNDGYIRNSMREDLVLDVRGITSEVPDEDLDKVKGTPVILWPQNNPPTANQLWIQDSANSGRFISKLNNNLVLDVSGDPSPDNATGSKVSIWTRNSPKTPNQSWTTINKSTGTRPKDELLPGFFLFGRYDALFSSDDRFLLNLQGDCNLVLYEASTRRPMWDTKTEGKGTNCHADMQEDGNLVVYSGSHKALWASNTEGNPNSKAVLQSDGNFVIYNQTGRALWASNTNVGGGGSASGGGGGSSGGTNISRVCAGMNLEGYVIINTETNSIGGCPAGQFNVWVEQQITNLPIGSTVFVCAGQAPPNGWVDVGSQTEYARCQAFQSGNQENNIRRFKRIS